MWYKNVKFWALAALAICISIAVLALRALFQAPVEQHQDEQPGFGGLPPAPKAIQQAAEKAYEEAVVVKAVSKATTDEKKKQLDDISKVDDGRERRKALAKFVENA